jgi:8-oxo-dGTP diphosphatase
MEDEPLSDVTVKRSARLVILDREGRLLLFRYHDQRRPPFWATAGGRLEPGETYLAAAARELHEETGFHASVGRLLKTRDEVFPVARSGTARYIEHYFLVETAAGSPDRTNWTEQERETIRMHRWWSVNDMKSTTETILPKWLPGLVEATLAELDPNHR